MSLTIHGYPILFTLLLWWFSTGAILYLDGLPRRTFRWSLAGASVVLAAALVTLKLTATDTGIGAAYCAFTAALLVWGWLEMSFLMGYITGPRTTACPPGSSGWRRVSFAIEAILYHEIALLFGALLVAAMTWQAPNQIGLATFAVLWVSRQSAKLNVFLGARNLSEEFLPEHLRYLQSYFTRRPMNLLFPLSVTVGTVGAAVLWQMAFADSIPAADAVGLSFLATLLTLATVEHWFLMLPIPSGELWSWGLRSRRAAPPDAPNDPRMEVRAL